MCFFCRSAVTGFQNDNPYAAPETVEEDAPGYDLRKIARLYNRLGTSMNWFVSLFILEIVLFFLVLAFMPLQSISIVLREILCVVFLLIFPVVSLAFLYSTYLTIRIARATKCSIFVIILITGIVPFGIFNVITKMWNRAEQVLRDGGVEIINDKVDLTQITVEEDY